MTEQSHGLACCIPEISLRDLQFHSEKAKARTKYNPIRQCYKVAKTFALENLSHGRGWRALKIPTDGG